ncbi:hypothetical protein AB4142_36105, partial [Variovorax sp. 2RAF20]
MREELGGNGITRSETQQLRGIAAKFIEGSVCHPFAPLLSNPIQICVPFGTIAAMARKLRTTKG